MKSLDAALVLYLFSLLELVRSELRGVAHAEYNQLNADWRELKTMMFPSKPLPKKKDSSKSAKTMAKISAKTKVPTVLVTKAPVAPIKPPPLPPKDGPMKEGKGSSHVDKFPSASDAPTGVPSPEDSGNATMSPAPVASPQIDTGVPVTGETDIPTMSPVKTSVPSMVTNVDSAMPQAPA